jgi:hypothetical protein
LMEVPTVCEHRDFSPWNVLVAGDGRLSVVDWESSTMRGVAGLDLIYFLSYLALYRDGVFGSRFGRHSIDARRASYAAAWSGTTITGRTNRTHLAAYAARLGIRSDALHALRLLTWLVHARADRRQALASSRRAAAAGQEGDGLFLNLLDEELRRGPG